MVKPGDALAVDQPVLELETDKATIEVPSNVAGTVTEVKVRAGHRVNPGQAVLVLSSGAGGAVEKPKQDAAKPEPPKAEAPKQEAAPAAAAGEQPPAPERPKASVHNIASARPQQQAPVAAAPQQAPPQQ